MELRPMTEDDVDFVTALLQDPEVAPWWPRMDTARVRAFLDDDDCAYLIIEHDGRPVGVIDWYEEDDPDYRHAGMDIAVYPSVFGQGVAVAALREVARMLVEERGHHRLIIDPTAWPSTSACRPGPSTGSCAATTCPVWTASTVRPASPSAVMSGPVPASSCTWM